MGAHWIRRFISINGRIHHAAETLLSIMIYYMRSPWSGHQLLSWLVYIEILIIILRFIWGKSVKLRGSKLDYIAEFLLTLLIVYLLYLLSRFSYKCDTTTIKR